MALVAQWVKNLPAKQEMQVRSLDLEDPLEEVMATHEGLHLHGVQVPHIAGWKTQGEVALMRLPDSRALGLTNDVHKFMARCI